ncbi:MAG: class I SAM-dependent methyltransferase [candidate division Zixibacteria bacterium]|nr:class I SAM-dependent methyltransferase [candidate division Zixibacteria bacterium]
MTDHKLIDYYRARASEYEQIYYRDVPDRRKEIDEEADHLRQLVKDRHVLELACGTGYWTEIMAETAASIVASDVSPEMIAEAKKKNLRGKVSFVRSDLNRSAFAKDTFDFIALGFWFSHHPRQHHGALFGTLLALLKEGCPAWLIDNNPPAEGPAVESVHTDKHGNNFKHRFLDNGAEHTILKNYFTKDQLCSIFTPHFQIERLTHNKYYWSAVLSGINATGAST